MCSASRGALKTAPCHVLWAFGIRINCLIYNIVIAWFHRNWAYVRWLGIKHIASLHNFHLLYLMYDNMPSFQTSKIIYIYSMVTQHIIIFITLIFSQEHFIFRIEFSSYIFGGMAGHAWCFQGLTYRWHGACSLANWHLTSHTWCHNDNYSLVKTSEIKLFIDMFLCI